MPLLLAHSPPAFKASRVLCLAAVRVSVLYHWHKPPPPNLITLHTQEKPSVSPATALAINDGEKHRLPYPPSSPRWISQSVIRKLYG